jgi:hypothetical protein
MQRDGSEKRQMLEVRDLERPLGGGGLTPIEAVIDVAKSDCLDEWARYCDLAHRLFFSPPKAQTAVARFPNGDRQMNANSKHKALAAKRETWSAREIESANWTQPIVVPTLKKGVTGMTPIRAKPTTKKASGSYHGARPDSL